MKLIIEGSDEKLNKLHKSLALAAKRRGFQMELVEDKEVKEVPKPKKKATKKED